MMLKVLIFFAWAILVDAQSSFGSSRVDYSDDAAPTPYQFSYTAPAIGGSSSRQEVGDEYGRITGSYTVDDDDGRSRIVEYVADEYGFRAAISTNEPGTANQNPADVTISSSADDGFGGPERLQSPSTAVAAVPALPVAPATPVAPAEPPAPARLSPRRPALPRRRLALVSAQPRQPAPAPARPALIPVQSAPAPIQPALVPIQPTLVPVQPAVFPRRFITPPAFFPFDARRYLPGPAFLPFENRRLIAPPALIPIDNTRVVSDPFTDRSFFRPFDRDILV